MGSKQPIAPPTPAVVGEGEIKATEQQISAAFTEWERRWREEPDRFLSEQDKLLNHTPETYGEACAPYFIAIANGQI